MDVLHHTAQD